MRLHQPPAQGGKFFKGLAVIHEGNPRKVDFQDPGIFLPVRGAVEHGIDIPQDFLRLVMIAVFQVHEGAKLGGEVFAALVVFSLKFLDEKVVILVMVGLFISGVVVKVEGKKIKRLLPLLPKSAIIN